LISCQFFANQRHCRRLQVNGLAAELQTKLRPSGHPTTLQAAWAARRPVG
jgi:hypothetical protein